MSEPLPRTQGSIPQELERVLASREFSRAEYLCRFLRCCVEQTLSGNVSQLKEFWLGRSVFQRDKTFDPSIDPIVRVQARRLRQKLDRYYGNEGRGNDVRIVLPVGTYVPQFLTGDQLGVPTPPPRKVPSLALLPFITTGGDATTSSLAEILTDELIHLIVDRGRFLVVSRLSSSRFKDISDDARTIGKALNADLLIEGRVQCEPGIQNVSVQLTDAASGYHLWSLCFTFAGPVLKQEVCDVTLHIAAILESRNVA